VSVSRTERDDALAIGRLVDEYTDAVSRGDANAAADLTRAHLATSHEFILRFLLDSEHESEFTAPESEKTRAETSFGIVGGGLTG